MQPPFARISLPYRELVPMCTAARPAAGNPLQSGCWREISLCKQKSAPDERSLPRPLPLSRMGRTIDPARAFSA